jgi:tetratricopeptide (TPR) repeat protein
MGAPRTTLFSALGLALAVFLLYFPVRAHGWVKYDDDVYLLENPHVQRGLDPGEVLWVFTHDHAANYHPLTWVSHMLDVELFGLEPGPHHLVSVALHALNAALVLLLLRALVGGELFAGLGAALWALHPLRVESVAWAAERKDVLCAVFFLAGLLAYLRYARSPSAGRYALVCLALVLALLAKPMAVTFPLVALLLDVWPLGRLKTESGKPEAATAAGPPSLTPTRPGEPAQAPGGRSLYGLFLEKLPLLVLSALAALATVVAQSRGGSTSSISALGLDVRALNALRSVGVYLRETVWPAGLSVFYPHEAILSADPRVALLAPAGVGAALLVGLSALAWRARRAAPAALAGWLAFLTLLLPVIGLVQVGTQAHADRYTYLPAVGLSAALAGAAGRLAGRTARVAGLLGVAGALALAGAARHQLAAWRDTETLFRRALELDPRNYLAHMKLGELALDAGDEPAARAAFQRALAIHPGFVEALDDLALCHLARGELDEARTLLERALRLAPDDYDTWLNLGAVELERGDLAAARARFEACRTRRPDDPEAHFDLAGVEQRAGRLDEAERDLCAALDLDPGYADAWSNLGQVHLARERTDEAVAAFERAAALVPGDPLAHFNLGVALRRAGEPGRAREAFRRALELDPALELAREALGALEDGG